MLPVQGGVHRQGICLFSSVDRKAKRVGSAPNEPVYMPNGPGTLVVFGNTEWGVRVE